jgi:hypothetical protein
MLGLRYQDMHQIERATADPNESTQHYIAAMFKSMDDYGDGMRNCSKTVYHSGIGEEWYRDSDVELDIVKRIVLARASRTLTRVTVDRIADGRVRTTICYERTFGTGRARPHPDLVRVDLSSWLP